MDVQNGCCSERFLLSDTLEPRAMRIALVMVVIEMQFLIGLVSGGYIGLTVDYVIMLI